LGGASARSGRGDIGAEPGQQHSGGFIVQVLRDEAAGEGGVENGSAKIMRFALPDFTWRD